MHEYDVNIDYLTITTTHAEDIAGFVSAFQKSVPVEAGARPFHWMGYVGEYYVADEGHLAWGVKLGHGICQMSGLWSDKVFRNLDQFRLLDYRCTRLDLAVTVAIPTPRQLVREAIKNRDISGGNWTTILKTNGEGGTLYIGCRKSDQFARLYDKGAEIRSRLAKETIPNCVLWRYEVEYKRSMAQAMRDSLARGICEEGWLDGQIANAVHDWFLARGVSPTFTPEERDSSVVSVATRVTNVQKTLDWMRVQVRPAIVRIADDVGTQAIMSALGVEIDGDARVRQTRPTMTPFQHSLWQEGPDQL
jgi:DNA relaxase NicK